MANDKSVSIQKFLAVAACLKDETIITPEIMSELISIGARIEDIENASIIFAKSKKENRTSDNGAR